MKKGRAFTHRAHEGRVVRVSVITGFNTDIEHAGTTYHVQTEDKGLETPLILSLVYVGGAILASKRTNYQDLVDSGFTSDELAERLQRQHKLICAAIKAGRIDDLKKMSGAQEGKAKARKAPAPKDAPSAPEAAAPPPLEGMVNVAPPSQVAPTFIDREHTLPPSAVAPPPQPDTTPTATNAGGLDLLSPDEEMYPAPTPADAAPPPEPSELVAEPPAIPAAPPEPQYESPEVAKMFYIRLLDDEGDFRAGELVTIRIHVGRGPYGNVPVRRAEVIIKVLGTTFRPLIVTTETDEQGIAVVRALLPRFNAGRAAILIRARADEYEAELRRIIKQA